MVRELFVMARQHAPTIIFMDEIDSIGGSRMEGGKGGDSEVQRTMLELLNQLDGFEPTQNIKVKSLACSLSIGVFFFVPHSSLLNFWVIVCLIPTAGVDGDEPYRHFGPCLAPPGSYRPQN